MTRRHVTACVETTMGKEPQMRAFRLLVVISTVALTVAIAVSFAVEAVVGRDLRLAAERAAEEGGP